VNEPADLGPTLAIVVKGYPRLSETFIAQEIAAFEERGRNVLIVSLRHPTENKTHPVHKRIRAGVLYLPEYLYEEPMRVLKAWWAVRRLPGYRAALRQWLADWRRDRTPNRGRRFGQALVLAHDLPDTVQALHVHFLHTPASVTRYAAMIRDLPWSGSAHAKDVWTTPAWELREKLTHCRWLVTCTDVGCRHLTAHAPAHRVELVYHGLDLARLPPAPAPRSPRNGANANDPVTILSVGRRVEKKGFDDVLAALALLPKDLHWNFNHIGGGPLGDTLKAQARRLGIADRCTWHGAQAQQFVFDSYADADLFVLASRIANDGDRDGLPNVLMEAQSQALACVSTKVSAIPELIEDGQSGVLVPPQDPPALARAIERLIRDPALRAQLGQRGHDIVRQRFSFEAGVERLLARLPR